MEFENNIPIYLQLVEAMKLQIIAGQLNPGNRIPSVRELAMLHKVNPNTMQKALIELENLKLVYTERTAGKYVTLKSDELSLKVLPGDNISQGTGAMITGINKQSVVNLGSDIRYIATSSPKFVKKGAFFIGSLWFLWNFTFIFYNTHSFFFN